MGGLRQYAVALLEILAADQENRYFVYHESQDPQIMTLFQKHPQLVHVSLRRRYWLTNKIRRKLDALYNRILDRPSKDVLLEAICHKYNIQVIHCPYQYLPMAEKVSSVFTMHDVQELHYPEYFTPEDRAYRAVHYLRYLKEASAVIVSYAHVKQDLIKYFGVEEDKIHICLLNMSKLWLDRYSVSDVVPIEQLPVNSGYLLYPANTWAHKNHLGIMKAILALRARGKRVNLVFTGHQTSYYEEVLLPFIDENHLEEQVSFLGIVDETTLYSLYKHARGVVVPTLYEAGSFPLMEALLINIPVICSNVTSLPETIGSEKFVFDPHSPADIADKMILLCDDELFRSDNLKNGALQAANLRENRILEKISHIYKSVL